MLSIEIKGKLTMKYENISKLADCYNYNIKLVSGCKGCCIYWTTGGIKKCHVCNRCAHCCQDITRENSCAYKEGAVVAKIKPLELHVEAESHIAYKNNGNQMEIFLVPMADADKEPTQEQSTEPLQPLEDSNGGSDNDNSSSNNLATTIIDMTMNEVDKSVTQEIEKLCLEYINYVESVSKQLAGLNDKINLLDEKIRRMLNSRK